MSVSELQLRSAQLASKVGTLARELRLEAAQMAAQHPAEAQAMLALAPALERMGDSFDAIAYAQATATPLAPTPAGT